MLHGKLQKVLLYLVLLLLITTVSGMVMFYCLLGQEKQNNFQLEKKAEVKNNNNQFLANPKEEINLLLLGTDQKQDERARSDTLMIANIDGATEEISIISIPRDTRVKFPDGKYHKINAAYSYGGVELVQNTISQFLGIEIDYYLNINYNNFTDLVDLIDGVELKVAKDLQYVDQAASLNIDLAAGKQILNGEQALDYVRFRHDYLGDIGRVQRQQKFLRAVADKLLTPSMVFKLPKLLNKVSNTVDTNLALSDFAVLAKLIKDIKLEQIKTVTLPGEADYISGISYWVVTEEKLNSLLTSFNFIS
ncbi:LCP family protein [Halanaerobacter jeridensis]|uniref:LCP family protein required for cell wall assembly n=1 Tax=Halanaerobacter jeridensis TaxID=706427 RepID=A0A938XNT0_9FIRM|nr:LCP family protein [Halanaerobacter jeridensis]MBM7556213.1 LCP family protein required for cell wall assembly [Halanaerobacter jeridensis]